ncbi:hypothetical protein EK21DRAFT_84595 [Setomelanomma holmii]|uniref:Uncharacterized protein n=1 Tax=Setomelanomma holmii TaxID=210430 RepID=A0A9P4HJJ2_9PLEO|nr:hypothetical protein EK21DRAFT_84595 [Setomelanomma holmii]
MAAMSFHLFVVSGLALVHAAAIPPTNPTAGPPGWSNEEILALTSVLVAITGIFIALIISLPKLRRWLFSSCKSAFTQMVQARSLFFANTLKTREPDDGSVMKSGSSFASGGRWSKDTMYRDGNVQMRAKSTLEPICRMSKKMGGSLVGCIGRFAPTMEIVIEGL